jgi:hypothetical protein
MVEYHVNAYREFQEKMNKETKFGGNLSVRLKKEEKLLIMFGHDEAIFKEYLLMKKAWYGPVGKSLLVPKDDGHGVMISAFQVRKLGFGMASTKEQLDEVNFLRRGKKYINEEAAKRYKGRAQKLTFCAVNLFLNLIMGHQTKVIGTMTRLCGCLKCLYPHYEFLFLFDHSCGHDKQQPNGLNAENMLKTYGGEQSILRLTVIK